MEIPGISVTVRDSGWRSNNLAEIVGNGSRGCSDRVNLYSKNGSIQRDLGQPFFVVDIEVPENNNLDIWVLLEKAMELLGSDFKDFTGTRSIQKRKEGKSSS